MHARYLPMNLLATLLRVENRVDTWLAPSEDLSGNASGAKSTLRAYAQQQWIRASSESFSPDDVKEVASTSNSFTVEMTAKGIGTSDIKIAWDDVSYTVTYKTFRQDDDTIVQCRKEMLYETLYTAIIRCWP